MRMEIGESANSVKFFDDQGQEVTIPCQEIKMHLKANDCTAVDLIGVYMDGIILEPSDDKVTITPKP